MSQQLPTRVARGNAFPQLPRPISKACRSGDKQSSLPICASRECRKSSVQLKSGERDVQKLQPRRSAPPSGIFSTGSYFNPSEPPLMPFIDLAFRLKPVGQVVSVFVTA